METSIWQNIKRLFCRHQYRLVATHADSHLQLFRCEKCKVYRVSNKVTHMHYTTNEVPLEHWIINWDKKKNVE